jgi:hypothetical protein
MEVIIWEFIVRVIRIPGALFLAAVTKNSFDHWMERGSIYGVAIMGVAIIGMFVLLAVLASG